MLGLDLCCSGCMCVCIYVFYVFIIFIYILCLLITSHISICLFFIVGVFNYITVPIFLLF